MKMFLAVFALLLSTIAIAYEVDNFTDRYKPLKDSRDVLNDQVNKKMAEAAVAANKKGACDPIKLEEALYKEMSGWVIGSLEDFAADSPDIEKHKPTKNHIYSQRDFGSKVAGFMMTGVGLNPSINLNGQYIGVDKLGHFIDQGYEYLQLAGQNSNPSEGVKQALDFGLEQENGEYGISTTGIRSHADLAANYSGLQFWASLTGGSRAHFKCQNNQWVQVRYFDFKDYVNPAWDEAINCNSHTSNRLLKSINDQVTVLNDTAKRNGKERSFTCPVSPNDCVKMKKAYGDKAVKILSGKCYSAQATSEDVKHSAQVSATSLGTSKYDHVGTSAKPTSNRQEGTR